MIPPFQIYIKYIFIIDTTLKTYYNERNKYFCKGENSMKNVIKIAVGTALTTILTTFTLGIINGSGSKQYTAEDIPGIGWVMKVTKTAGKSIGEKIRSPEPISNAGSN